MAPTSVCILAVLASQARAQGRQSVRLIQDWEFSGSALQKESGDRVLAREVQASKLGVQAQGRRKWKVEGSKRLRDQRSQRARTWRSRNTRARERDYWNLSFRANKIPAWRLWCWAIGADNAEVDSILETGSKNKTSFVRCFQTSWLVLQHCLLSFIQDVDSIYFNYRLPAFSNHRKQLIIRIKPIIKNSHICVRSTHSRIYSAHLLDALCVYWQKMKNT